MKKTMTVNDQLHSYYQCCFRSILTRHSPNIIYHIFSNVCCYSKAVFVIPKGPGPAGMTKVQYLTPFNEVGLVVGVEGEKETDQKKR